MQVGIDVKCMCIKFGGHSLFGFGDTGTFYSPWSSKILIDRNRPKNLCKYGLMSNACTSNLVGAVSLVLGILVLSKTAKFPFRTMDYSPWSSKKLIDRNWPKKFMQVGIDVTCMYIDFGGRGLFGFGDIGTFKNSQISLINPWTIVHGHQKF